MSEQKTFFTYFSRFTPTEEQRAALSGAVSFRAVGKRNDLGKIERVEVYLTFPQHVSPGILYSIEEACTSFYELRSFRILPSYPAETFSLAMMGEVTEEAARCGSVVPGFFSGATYADDGEVLTVSLPFLQPGVDIVRAHTPEMLSRILESRFGVHRRVVITASEDAEERTRERHAAYDTLLAEAEREAAAAVAADRAAARAARTAETPVEEEKPVLPKVRTLLPDDVRSVPLDKTTFEMGNMVFSTEGAELLFGDPFSLETPLAIGDAEVGRGTVVLLGEVFAVGTKETRAGDKVTISVGITDHTCSIYLKKTCPPDEVTWSKGLKPGTVLAVQGRVYRDKFEQDLTLSPVAAYRIS